MRIGNGWGRRGAAVVWLLAAQAGFPGLALGTPAPPPLAAFFQGPAIQDAAISPDGRYLALIVSAGGKSFIAVDDRIAKKSWWPVLAAPANHNMHPTWCHWANPTRVLCGFAGDTWDADAERYYPITRLAAVNADGSDRKVLIYDRMSSSPQAQLEASVIDWLPADPQHVLIDYPSTDPNDSGWPGVYSLNVYNGEMDRVVAPDARHSIAWYGTDGQGHVRFRWGVTLDDGEEYIYARLANEKSWRQLARAQLFAGRDAFKPIAVIPGTNFVYAMRDYQGHRALWKIDLTDLHDPELIAHARDVDLEPLLSPDGLLLGVTYETDKPGAVYFDPRAELLGTVLSQLFRGYMFQIVDMTQDLKVAVVEVETESKPPTFYVLDLNHQPPLLQKIGSAYPGLAGAALATTRAVTYPARDGTQIPGYLTWPAVLAVGSPPPLIVLPHGGPTARDDWGFDLWAQVLASHGYAVLRMNFRGSSGYGGRWLDLGRDWAGLPYTDVIDGTRWALAHGYGDPKRTCIVGGSFGGFLALTAAVRSGTLFRCAVSVAGVSDLSRLAKDVGWLDGSALARQSIGTRPDQYAAESPWLHAGAVQIPVLLLQGDEDYTVDPEQARLMDAALTRAGKPHETVFIHGANHYFPSAAEAEQLFTSMSAFLARYLDASPQVAASGH